MDIQTAKIELVKLIINTNDQPIIEKLIQVLKSEQTDFYPELSNREKQEIKLGIKQLNADQRIPLSDFLQKIS